VIEFLLGGIVVLVAGYLISRNHHRFRQAASINAFGVAGSPTLPSVADVQGRADDACSGGDSSGSSDASSGGNDGGGCSSSD
jgi:hypothetical protein